MTGPSFRFRPGHVPDFGTKYDREPGLLHRCECGYYAPSWDGLVAHCLVTAGELKAAA